jgi:hypothetical protein
MSYTPPHDYYSKSFWTWVQPARSEKCAWQAGNRGTSKAGGKRQEYQQEKT